MYKIALNPMIYFPKFPLITKEVKFFHSKNFTLNHWEGLFITYLEKSVS